jgi:hypothetical protein
MSLEPLFSSYFLAGFECSAYVRHDGRRLDLIASTRHDRFAQADYEACAKLGVTAARDGTRWHLIETAPYRYDWSSLVPMLRAARAAGTTVAWDLLHYGWPDDLDIWTPDFVERFAAYCRAATEVIADESGGRVVVCPVNEISYFAWAAGDQAHWRPQCEGRGWELKRQLVRAAVAGCKAVLSVAPDARFIWAEPAINVIAGGLATDEERHEAVGYHEAQFEALDLLCGRQEPELGGDMRYLDVVGVNYYPHNQWYYKGTCIPLGGADYRPFSELLLDVWNRYGRPILLAETGAEASGRAAWLHYVSDEVRLAAAAGAEIGGICIYPITAYPGWSNDRYCHTGVFSYADDQGRRTVYQPLADELLRQETLFEAARPKRVRRVG